MTGTGFMSGHPFKGFFQKILTDGHTVHQVFAQPVGAAVGFGEMPLGIAHKGSGIDGIVQLLVGERLAGDVDGAEPL